MAHHSSALKRIRQTEKKRVHNRYFSRSTRNAVKQLRETTDKEAATGLFPKVSAMVDKLAKKNIIHNKKAANLKSSLAKHVNGL